MYQKTIQSRTRTESSTSGKTEAANSKTLTSSIAQMTIGTAPHVMTTSTIRHGRHHACHQHYCSGQKSAKHVCRVRGRYNHGCSVRGPDDHRESIPNAPAPTGLPLPFDRVSTLLGNVPLSVPSVCATDAGRAPRRKPENDENYLVNHQSRMVSHSGIFRAHTRHSRSCDGTFAITRGGPRIAGHPV